jgi:hypothetical protein
MSRYNAYLLAPGFQLLTWGIRMIYADDFLIGLVVGAVGSMLGVGAAYY